MSKPTSPRGRPPKPEGAATPAERKRAQRERDKVALWSAGVSFDSLTTGALIDHLAYLVANQQTGTLGPVLVELGRRGGMTVTARATGTKGQRVRM